MFSPSGFDIVGSDPKEGLDGRIVTKVKSGSQGFDPTLPNWAAGRRLEYEGGLLPWLERWDAADAWFEKRGEEGQLGSVVTVATCAFG